MRQAWYKITTKLIYLGPNGYLNPREIIDGIFLIKKPDDEGQNFETIVPNK